VNCTISGNLANAGGGGLYNTASNIGSASVTLTNSTLSGNSSGASVSQTGLGGAVFNVGGAVTAINSTISGNNAYAAAGAIYNLGTSGKVSSVTLRNCTVSDNIVGGIFNSAGFGMGSSTLTLSNTILNTGTGSGANLNNGSNGTITSQGHNLSNDAAGGDGNPGPGGFLNATGDIRNTNPRLGPLQNNGGPTMTHALLSNSPAIDAGEPNFNPHAFDPPLLYDQRNSRRFPRVVNGRIDIGAFEITKCDNNH